MMLVSASRLNLIEGVHEFMRSLGLGTDWDCSPALTSRPQAKYFVFVQNIYVSVHVQV